MSKNGEKYQLWPVVSILVVFVPVTYFFKKKGNESFQQIENVKIKTQSAFKHSETYTCKLMKGWHCPLGKMFLMGKERLFFLAALKSSGTIYFL